jgi:hypothetical protein
MEQPTNVKRNKIVKINLIRSKPHNASNMRRALFARRP